MPSLTEERLTSGQRTAIIDGFGRLPGVRAVSVSDTAPGDERHENHNNMSLPGMTGPGISLMSIQIDRGFFRTYQPALLAGRLLDDAHRDDDFAGKPDGQGLNIVLNRRGAAVLAAGRGQCPLQAQQGDPHRRCAAGGATRLRAAQLAEARSRSDPLVQQAALLHAVGALDREAFE